MSSKPAGVRGRRFTSIPGFSDQAELPRIAKLRLGIREKKGTDKEHPRETDHFVLDVEESVAPEAASEVRERFVELYGERPQILTNVRLLSPNRDDAFSSSYEWWRSGKMFCHGNGVEAMRKIDGEWKEWAPAKPCANNGCGDFGSRKCGLQSRLRFMLPDVSIAGFFQVDTGSIYSAANVRNGLNLIEALTTQMFGEPRITAMPLILARAPQKIEWDGKLNEHFILHLTPQNFTMESLQKQIGAPAPLLTAGSPIIPDDEEDLPEEQIPASEHEEPPPFDQVLEDRIVTGFAMMEINEGTQTALRSRFPVQADLVKELERQYTEKQREKKAAKKGAA